MAESIGFHGLEKENFHEKNHTKIVTGTQREYYEHIYL